MKILHLSDTHGYFPPLLSGEEFDLIVHSGDFLPNLAGARASKFWDLARQESKDFQLEWLTEKKKEFNVWRQGKPFLYIAGNHDFLTDWTFLGSNVIDLTNQDMQYHGLNWSGFSFVSQIHGFWNFEKEEIELEKLFSARLQAWVENNSFPDIIISHAPPHGILDIVLRDGVGSVGLWPLRKYLEGWYPNSRSPKLVLCGHIHESHGIKFLGAEENQIIISQAATQIHLLEI